ncbi:MAG: hypothetical protein J6P65_01040 [Bacteroidales bacterium]|nr:hypothetical protein [Bacteroidales bacterium]
MIRQRAFVLILVITLAGALLSAQESQYVFNDVTTGLQPTFSSYNTIPYELREDNVHGNVVKIIETQDYHPNPSHDYTGYFLIERDKKYSKHIFYTTTPKTTTTFSYSSDGKISSIDQEIVETTFYRRIETAVLLSTHDQKSSNRRRRHIRRSSATPTLNSSQTILNRFTFQNGLPILWEQKRGGGDDSWRKMEAIRYDSLQRIKSQCHYEQNRLEDITTYTYDDHNRIVTEKRVPFTINKKDSPTLHKQYYYDDSLHSTIETDLLRDSTAYPFTASRRFTSQYDAQGRLICVEGEHLGYYNPYPNRCCSISSTICKVTFKYDDHGALSEKSYYSGDGMTVMYSLTWKYEYDDKGNWVKCLHYENGFLLKKSERKIIYP